MANIKKGDLVQVISGQSQARGGDRGKQGTVIEVLGEQNRVVVQGVNFVTRHVRVGQSDRGSKTKNPTRVGFRLEQVTKNGVTKTVRVRYAKKSGKDLP